MLKLKKKTATMGVVNNRIEVHGDEDVTAFDIPFDLLLDPDEYCDVLEDKHAHSMQFNTPKGGVAEPLWPNLGDFVLKHDLEGQRASIHIGQGSTLYEIEFSKARLKGISFQRLTGGEVQMHFKLQVCPEVKHITKLINAQKTSVKLSVGDLSVVERAKRQQQDLPLGAPGEEADDDADAGETQAAALSHKPGDAPIDGTTGKSRARSRRAKADAAGEGVH